MHSEQAQVVASALTGYDQSLFGSGWRWFLDDRIDFVDTGLSRHRHTTHGTEEGQLVFASRLDG